MNMILNPAQELIYIKDMTNILDFKSINTEFNNLKFTNNQYNDISVGLKFFDDIIFKNSKELLELECKSYLNECYNIKDMYDDIAITSSWGNITKEKQSHHEHTHPLSVVSGVIYLDNNIDNLNLNFVLQNSIMMNIILMNVILMNVILVNVLMMNVIFINVFLIKVLMMNDILIKF